MFHFLISVKTFFFRWANNIQIQITDAGNLFRNLHETTWLLSWKPNGQRKTEILILPKLSFSYVLDLTFLGDPDLTIDNLEENASAENKATSTAQLFIACMFNMQWKRCQLRPNLLHLNFETNILFSLK